jgi:hypothetical protein
MDRFLALSIAALCMTVLLAIVSGDTVAMPSFRSLMV